jgi:hypothetical protein
MLQSLVGSIPLDWQPKAFAVATDAENRMSASCTTPTEETLIEAYRRLQNPLGDPASLPRVRLRVLDRLGRHSRMSIVSVDCVVQCRVRPWLRCLYLLECVGRDLLQAHVGFLELMLFRICQRCKVKLHHLLCCCLPNSGMFSEKLCRDASKCSAIPPTNQFVGFLGVFYDGIALRDLPSLAGMLRRRAKREKQFLH